MNEPSNPRNLETLPNTRKRGGECINQDRPNEKRLAGTSFHAVRASADWTNNFSCAGAEVEPYCLTRCWGSDEGTSGEAEFGGGRFCSCLSRFLDRSFRNSQSLIQRRSSP